MTTLSINQVFGLLIIFAVFNFSISVVIHGIVRFFHYEYDND